MFTNGLYQYFIGQEFIRGNYLGGGRMSSSMRHANDFGAYLIFIAPMLLSISWLVTFGKINSSAGGAYGPEFRLFFSKKGKTAVCILFIFSAICLGLTFSRGAWLALIIAAIVMGFLERKLLAVSLAVIFIFFGVFYSQMIEIRGVNFITDTIKRTQKIPKVATVRQLSASGDRLGRKPKETTLQANITSENVRHLGVSPVNWNFGDKDFTIDYWYYPKDTKDNDGYFSLMRNYKNCLYLRGNTSAALELGFKKDGTFEWFRTFPNKCNLNQWNHIAVVRDNNQVYCFINGRRLAVIQIPEENLTFPYVVLGFWETGNKNFGFSNGYIYGFRITKEQALFKSDFKLEPLYAQFKKLLKDSSLEQTIKTGLVEGQEGHMYALDATNGHAILVLHDLGEKSPGTSNFKEKFITSIYRAIPPAIIEKEDAKRQSAVQATQERRQEILDEREKIFLALQQFGGSGRRKYWQEAFNIIKDYPFFGIGVNAYSLVGARYKISWGGYPHNCYLQIASEIGIPGLFSFLFILFVLFRRSIRALSSIDDIFLRFLLLGALSAYGAFLVQSFFDTFFYSVQLGTLMWIFMGLIVAIQRLGTKGYSNGLESGFQK